MRKTLLLSAGLALSASAIQASTIVSADSATASSEFGASFDIGNTIDQSGLNTGYVSGVTNFDDYIALAPLHTFAAADYEWFTALGVTSARLVFDLGEVLTLDGIALWNEEVSGFGRGIVTSSTDGGIFSALTNIAPTDNPLSASYGADVFSFAATSLRFLAIDVSGCPQPNGDVSEYCALGEIAFRTAETVAPIPVPAGMPLLLGGLGALAWMRRRQG